MIFSDKDKQISVKDQNGNSIVMSESGITLNSPKDINITAEQNITINLGVYANGIRGGRLRSDSSRPSFYGSHCIMVATECTREIGWSELGLEPRGTGW